LTRARLILAVAAGATVLLLPGQSLGTSIALRTFRVTAPSPAKANDDSANPSISGHGRFIAFDSVADNLVKNAPGARPAKPAADRSFGTTLLVSTGLSGTRADGPSESPVISGDANTVAFTSAATNLVAGDTNNLRDVFVRTATAGIERASAPSDGGAAQVAGEQSNGSSSQPDLSANGRYVVFTSTGSNLVPGDDNGASDVFVRDLATGKTARVSVSSSGLEANGASSAAAISSDGSVVSFASAATNLTSGDHNDVADVFVHELTTGKTERVSVSATGSSQNKAVRSPFTQVSDLSRRGRYVVFDSDATNLVRGDRNRRTDVFRHDRKTGLTTLESQNDAGFEGNNDSFNPTITPSGTYVGFTSFATNLWPTLPSGEHTFLRSSELGLVTPLDVTATGNLRGPELRRQLLQRVSVANDGRLATFASTASNLTAGDSNGKADVFVRVLTPPQGNATQGPRTFSRSVKPTFFARIDDRTAIGFACRVDDATLAFCPPGKITLARAKPGKHVLRLRAIGPGMLPDPRELKIAFTVTHG